LPFKKRVNFSTWGVNTVDKYGDNVVDKVKIRPSEEYVSPYLRRPLRSFADVVADREVYRPQSKGLRSNGMAFEQDLNPKASSRRQH